MPEKNETPTIAVEFDSEGKRNLHRDYEVKREEYRTAGAREYWIIDRFEHTLTVHYFRRGKISEKSYGRKQKFRTELQPGFELPLAQSFESADRWDA